MQFTVIWYCLNKISSDTRVCFCPQEGTHIRVGRDRIGGIKTHYGLDGPRIESRWRQSFPHPSRSAPRPTQPPLQWVMSFLGKKRPGRGVHQPHLFRAEVKEGVQLYIYSLFGSSWPVVG
jgi:hypothetical protein